MTVPDGKFWDLVRAEIHASWGGRWRWLWRAFGLTFLAACLVLPAMGIGSDWFLPLVAIGSWVPAVLCSDLLSLEYEGNPEPQREWPFRAYAARFVGRLLPFFAAETTWIGVFTLRSLLEAGKATPGSINLLHSYQSVSDLMGHWTAWILVFLASGLPYATTAALISGAARRPRRWLVTLAVAAIGMAVASLLQLFVPPIMGSTGSMPDVSQQVQYFAYSAFSIGVSIVVAVLKNPNAVGWLPKSILEFIGTFPGYCLLATAAFFLYSAITMEWLRRIVNRRLRRRPFTASRVPVAEPDTDPSLAAVSDAGI